MKSAVAYADIFTGLYASNAILAALHGRAQTGDAGATSTWRSSIRSWAVLGNQAVHHLLTGESPPRVGNAHSAIVPYQVFPVADGHIIIACGK